MKTQKKGKSHSKNMVKVLTANELEINIEKVRRRELLPCSHLLFENYPLDSFMAHPFAWIKWQQINGFIVSNEKLKDAIKCHNLRIQSFDNLPYVHSREC